MYNLYKFANQPIVKAVRIGIFILFTALFVLNIFDIEFLQKMLLFYFLFAVNEIFIHEKINTAVSKKVASGVSPDEAVKYSARYILDQQKNIFHAMQIYSKHSDVKLFMARLGTAAFAEANVERLELLKKAAEIVIQNKQNFINEIDIVTAFLLLTESQTNFLIQHELHEKDVLAVYQWVCSIEKFQEKHPLSIPAVGAFDWLVTGWNYELRKYAINVTDDVVSDRREPRLIALETQYSQFLNDLSRNRENNILLVGEVGVGKRNIVRKFAFDSHFHHLEPQLNSRTVFELLTDRLIAGTEDRNQLQERLEYLFAELAHTGEVIVYIENIENLLGGGGFNMDVSGTLTPYLESGSFTIIGTINPSFYQKFIEPHESIKQHFSRITIPEVDSEQSVEVLLAHTEDLESKYGVWVVYSAIPEAVKLSGSYYPDRFLPGRAISLLEETLSSAHNQKKKVIDKHDVRNVVSAKTNIITEEPGDAEKELLLHLEDRMHEKLIDQEEAVTSIAKALRRLRSGFENKNRPIASFLFLGPTGVGKTETAKRLAELYFGSETAMLRLDMSEYQTQDAIRKLLGEMPGEEVIANTLINQIREHPFSLVLLDEFEKAHPELLNLFLQILDEGKITDNHGKVASFTNAIIIATSNAGSEFIRETGDIPDLKKQLIDALLSANKFKPELINRFDDTVVFHPLSPEHARQVANLILKSSLQKLDEEQITVEFDDSLLDSIIANGYSQEFGARNLRRYIQDNIEEFVSRQILENKLVRGDKKRLSVDASGQFVIT